MSIAVDIFFVRTQGNPMREPIAQRGIVNYPFLFELEAIVGVDGHNQNVKPPSKKFVSTKKVS